MLFREICICENHAKRVNALVRSVLQRIKQVVTYLSSQCFTVFSVVSPDAVSQSTGLTDSCVYYKRNLIRQIRTEMRINFLGCDDAGKICPCMAT